MVSFRVGWGCALYLAVVSCCVTPSQVAAVGVLSNQISRAGGIIGLHAGVLDGVRVENRSLQSGGGVVAPSLPVRGRKPAEAWLSEAFKSGQPQQLRGMEAQGKGKGRVKGNDTFAEDQSDLKDCTHCSGPNKSQGETMHDSHRSGYDENYVR